MHAPAQVAFIDLVVWSHDVSPLQVTGRCDLP